MQVVKYMSLRSQRISLLKLALVFTLVAIAVLLSSCARENRYNIDPELRPYVESFESLTRTKVTFDVHIVDAIQPMDPSFTVTPSILGLCSGGAGVSKLVQIKRSFWTAASTLSREQAVRHELTHCALDYRGHDTTLDHNSNPDSIMNPYIITDSVYEQKRLEFELEILMIATGLKVFGH